ncbi:MAG: hypothetical protein PUB00_00145 [Clostridiales bacterium]|nr:hypothetical protein [Clostridiales bacterium]
MALITSVAAKANVRVDSYYNKELQGVVYSTFYKACVPFRNTYEMMSVLESLFDKLHFPQSSMAHRRFGKNLNQKLIKKSGERMEQQEPLSGKANFVVHVQFRQNATWQGTVQWVDANKTQRFRSALELLKLMDEALDGNDEVTVNWESEEN